MTEFANADSLNRFKSELTIKVSTIPYCIILLDEIEKACPEVTRLLLQVLDDGRLIDDNEREVTFRNAYIIITTNAGNEVYKTISAYEESDKADFKKLEKYDKLIRESIRSESGSKFPPELLGRIDCIVPFQPLSKKTMMRILGMKIEAIANMVKQKHNVTLHVDKNIFVYLIFDKLDTDSDSGGARIVVSKLERELIVPLSRYINEHPFEKEVFISVDGDMAIYDKRQLESKAYVYVGKEFKNENVNLAKQIKLS
jgi:ATP-dependent Clp protease ATP-binding subunit ClpC